MTQVQLEDLLGSEYYEWVASLARERDVSVDSVIREAIENGLPVPQSRRVTAARLILSAEPVPMGEAEDIKAELDEVRGRWA